MFRFLKQLYRKNKYGEAVILVSGLPRSGTSMMMKMLDAAGLEIVTDQIRTADEDNPKGYFELEQVKDLDKIKDKGWVREYRGKVVKIISFLLKDLPEDSAYKVVFMRRDYHEVIASQNKMLVRRGEPTDESADEKMIQAYQVHLRKVDFMLKNQPNFESIDVDHRQVLDQPLAQARRVGAFLGGSFDLEKMAAVVDRKLYRNRAEKDGGTQSK